MGCTPSSPRVTSRRPVLAGAVTGSWAGSKGGKAKAWPLGGMPVPATTALTLCSTAAADVAVAEDADFLMNIITASFKSSESGSTASSSPSAVTSIQGMTPKPTSSPACSCLVSLAVAARPFAAPFGSTSLSCSVMCGVKLELWLAPSEASSAALVRPDPQRGRGVGGGADQGADAELARPPRHGLLVREHLLPQGEDHLQLLPVQPVGGVPHGEVEDGEGGHPDGHLQLLLRPLPEEVGAEGHVLHLPHHRPVGVHDRTVLQDHDGGGEQRGAVPAVVRPQLLLQGHGPPGDHALLDAPLGELRPPLEHLVHLVH